jgi:hypothetical protein
MLVNPAAKEIEVGGWRFKAILDKVTPRPNMENKT